jgi:hypothetical protein
MRKVLFLALISMCFAATACNKNEETPAPEASASAAPSEGASPAAASPEASTEASPAAPAPSAS